MVRTLLRPVVVHRSGGPVAFVLACAMLPPCSVATCFPVLRGVSVWSGVPVVSPVQGSFDVHVFFHRHIGHDLVTAGVRRELIEQVPLLVCEHLPHLDGRLVGSRLQLGSFVCEGRQLFPDGRRFWPVVPLHELVECLLLGVDLLPSRLLLRQKGRSYVLQLAFLIGREAQRVGQGRKDERFHGGVAEGEGRVALLFAMLFRGRAFRVPFSMLHLVILRVEVLGVLLLLGERGGRSHQEAQKSRPENESE